MFDSQLSYVGEDDAQFFRRVHGRRLNTMNERYMLPVDDDEIKRSELHHRLFKFMFGGKNYVGPVQEVLKPGQPRQILDLGSGGGFWAIEIADEFPRAEVIGIDLAPIQPRLVPPNCTFELFDLDQGELPYPENQFDLIHARSVHAGIHDYPRLLHELARVLRPGGLVILIEFDLHPRADGRAASDLAGTGHTPGLPGWFALWEAYRGCLEARQIDTHVPYRLKKWLSASGEFYTVVQNVVDIPIGFYPKDPLTLTIGQLAWMAFDLHLPGMKPLFLSSGIPACKVDALIEKAQKDLYRPPVHPSSRVYVVHGRKKDLRVMRSTVENTY